MKVWIRRIDRERETHRETERERERDTHTEREAGRERERERERDKINKECLVGKQKRYLERRERHTQTEKE